MSTPTERLAVVTGAAAGIGRAIAERMADDGDHVVVVDRDQARGRQTATEIAASRGPATFDHTDVGDADAVAAMADRLRDQFGRVDVLVNNAGVALREGSVATLSPKHWDLTIRVNLTSVYLVSHALIPLMPRGAAIVNVSTTGALRAVPGTDAYVAAKGGVVSLSRAMAVSLADLGIRVNAVCPGVVLTEEVASRTTDPRVRAMMTRAGEPLGRGFGAPEELAAVVRFLCSPEASYVNGAIVPVDGGGLA